MISSKPDRILRCQAVLQRTGFGHSTLYNQIHAGTFPAPVKLGKRAVGWRESEIEAWIADRPTAGSATTD